MASSITRFDIEKLDGNIGAQKDREADDFQVSNDDAAVAQRWLEKKKLEEKTNTDCLVNEQENVHFGGPWFEVPTLDEAVEYRYNRLRITTKVESVRIL
ncbi:hypothetical protein Tco_1434208 [Tanacetum coccineum]